jgi:phospholipase/carboxylesterase
MVPVVPDKLPDLSSVRVWMGAGDQDPIIPASETQHLIELLRPAGADVTIRFANATHGLTDADVKTARHWLGGLEPLWSKNLLPLRRISLLSQRR